MNKKELLFKIMLKENSSIYSDDDFECLTKSEVIKLIEQLEPTISELKEYCSITKCDRCVLQNNCLRNLPTHYNIELIKEVIAKWKNNTQK